MRPIILSIGTYTEECRYRGDSYKGSLRAQMKRLTLNHASKAARLLEAMTEKELAAWEACGGNGGERL